MAARVQSLVAQGLDVVEAYASARAATPSRELARIRKQQARVTAAHHKAMAKHTARVRGQRRNAVTLAAAAAGAGVLGVVDLISSGALPGDPWMWLGGAAVGGVLAVRTKWNADHALPPAAPETAAVIELDARAIPRDAIGWAEAQGLTAVRRQVATMVPAVAALHPDAGRELSHAEELAGPALGALVTRLLLLDQVARDLPGTGAGAAATAAAEQVRARLADGVTRYDQLLAAASALLAAPDLGVSTETVLGPAADALTAYAHGLGTAYGG
jgi:hypothetical protein